MKKRTFVFVALIALLTTLHGRSAGLGEKLRVLSVDLENAVIEMPGTPGSEISQELRNLLEKADPDVVCLQGVIDWESCERICKLKPGLRVLTCSAFPAAPGATAAPQVAILAGDRAVLSWVEEISDGGAFAFAVLQAGSRRLGVFSLQSAQSSGSLAATDRVLGEIKKLQNFPQNRPDAFLVAGSPLVKSSALIDQGLQSIAPDPKLLIATNRSEFWVANAGFIARPRNVTLPGLPASALVSDFDAGSSFSSKFAYQTPLLFAGENPAPPIAAVPVPAAAVEARSLAWPVAVAIVLVVLSVFWVLRKGSSPVGMQLVPLNSPDALTGPHLGDRESVRVGLLAWVKTVFVQRLLSQRQQLLSNEDEATRRTLLIEEKLSILQTTLQSRISAYEVRIDRLEQELTAASFENRDLIRSQIDLLKEKVAKAKEGQVFRRN